MMNGSLVFTGRVVRIEETPLGRLGRVSVRGATVEVVLDLVRAAGVGDTVLVHAGVAVSLLRDGGESVEA